MVTIPLIKLYDIPAGNAGVIVKVLTPEETKKFIGSIDAY